MQPEERKKLVKEIREEVRPLISQICNAQIRDGIQPLQRMIMQHQVETEAAQVKTNTKLENEIKTLSEKFSTNLDKASEDIYQNLRAI